VTTVPKRLARPSDDDTEPIWAVEIRAGSSPTTPVGELARLAKLHVWARWAVATNPACPPTLLSALSRDQAPLVRRAVALNRSTPERIRRRLAGDPDERVRPVMKISTPATMSPRKSPHRSLGSDARGRSLLGGEGEGPERSEVRGR